MAGPYLGDFAEDATVHFMWDSNDSNGASITRATNGTVSVYKDNGLTQTTTGVTDTEDFDGLTGIHACTIVTTDAFYVTGSNYTVVLSAATIDSQTVNAVLAHFSIENRWNESNVTSWNGVALSTTNPLPNAAAGAAGGLPTDSTGKTSFNDIAATDVVSAGAITTSGGAVSTVTTTTTATNLTNNNDKTGYSISGTKTTLDALNDVSTAEVNTEVDNSMVTYGLDHLLQTSVADTDVADNSVIAKFADSTAVTADYTNYDWTTDSLRAIRDHIGNGSNLTEAGGTGDHLSAIPDMATATAQTTAQNDLDIITGTNGVLVDDDAITAAKIAAGAITASEAPNLDAAISTRATPAQVNTEVADVLTVDTTTLPGQTAPPLAPTMEEMISYLYKAFRNRKAQTSTEWRLYADNETTVDQKATVSDDGSTAIKQEIASGP